MLCSYSIEDLRVVGVVGKVEKFSIMGCCVDARIVRSRVCAPESSVNVKVKVKETETDGKAWKRHQDGAAT
jgi:hypothetical protein